MVSIFRRSTEIRGTRHAQVRTTLISTPASRIRPAPTDTASPGVWCASIPVSDARQPHAVGHGSGGGRQQRDHLRSIGCPNRITTARVNAASTVPARTGPRATALRARLRPR